MIDQLLDYTISLYKGVPASVYVELMVSLFIGSVVIICKWGARRGWRKIGFLLLVEYVFLLYSSTVFFRTMSEKFSGHDYHPFWSYRAIFNGREELIVENLMNVAVFVPVGILLGSLLRVKGAWLIALLVGLCISVSIELMQFVMKRGFAEVDDVMHNTVGCVIGYGIYRLICSILYKFEGKR